MKPKRIRLFFTMLLLVIVSGCGENIDEMQSYGGITGPGGSSGTVTITITPTTLTGGTVNVAYSQALTAAGGTAPYTWSVVSGSLPTGITLGSTTGTLSGTPTVPGAYTFTVQARDSGLNSGTQSLSLTIYSALTITTTSPLTDAYENMSYASILNAAGGLPPYTWTNTSTLPSAPAGLTFSAASHSISGTPSPGSAGTYIYSVTVTDSATPANTSSADFTLKILTGLNITNTSPLATGTAGVAYGPVTLTATGGSTIYTWSVSAASQTAFSTAGFALDPGTGAITGTPTTATAAAGVSYSFTVDDGSIQFSKALSIPVKIGVTASPASATLSCGTSQVYNGTFTAVGATGTVSWTVDASAIPSNPTYTPPNGITATISYTAVCGDTGGPYVVTAIATDGGSGTTNSKSISITVSP